MVKKSVFTIGIGLTSLVLFISLITAGTAKCIELLHNPALHLTTYTDSEDPIKPGNSRILSYSYKDKINFSAIIGNGNSYPYAGFRFFPNDSQPFIDIKPYDLVEITVDSTNARYFILDLATYVDGYSHFDDFFSFRHHTKEIFTRSGPQVIRIPISAIPTQNWWYELRKLHPDKVGKPDLTRCRAVSFEINCVNPDGTPLHMTVSSIKFRQNPVLAQITAGIAAVLLFLLLISLRFVTRTLPASPVIAGRSVELKSSGEEEYARICSVVTDRYIECELSVADVARQAGIPRDRVSAVLTEYSGLTFKQFLNTMRVTESKRLLRGTDRQISEIADAVGFNYPSTFNRVFREIAGTSPTDFRRQSESEESLPTS